MAARMPDSSTASAAWSMWTPPASAKLVKPALIISKQASRALTRTSWGVRPLSKGTRTPDQVMGSVPPERPRSSCWQTWVWPSAKPGISSFPAPEMVSAASYFAPMASASPTSRITPSRMAAERCASVSKSRLSSVQS